MFLFFFFICCLSASLTQSADCFNNNKKREDNAKKKKRQKDSDLELRFFFLIRLSVCASRKATNVAVPATRCMRAHSQCVPRCQLHRCISWQLRSTTKEALCFFFLYVGCLHLGKLYLCLATKSNYNSSLFFFFSLTLLLCHFRHERSTSQKSVFFFSSSPLYSVIPFKHIYIYFCKVLKAQKSCMNFFACPSIAVFF